MQPLLSLFEATLHFSLAWCGVAPPLQQPITMVAANMKPSAICQVQKKNSRLKVGWLVEPRVVCFDLLYFRYCFQLAGQRFVARIRVNVFKAIINQEVAFFDTNRTGELTNRPVTLYIFSKPSYVFVPLVGTAWQPYQGPTH
jgi:hypothetical protein